MKNSEYWAQRFTQLEDAQNRLGADALNDIEKQYDEAIKELEGQIAKWYLRFAKNNEISLADARQWLRGKDLKEFKWDVHEYIRHGEENAIDGRWMKELENASARYHISKLDALKIRIRQSLEELHAKQEKTFTSAMGDVYRSGYYHTAFELQKGFSIGWDIAGIDNARLEKVLSKPWAADGYNFSERIWNNKQKLIQTLHQELTRNILTGADPQNAIDAVSKRMEASKRNAGRLVMTEEAYFSSAAQKEAFTDLGVEEFEIVATLDSHTSEICQEMDGKHFPMADYKPGETAPPFHPYCRSTTAPYFEDDFGSIGERAARDEEGNTYYVPADMKYGEWKKAFVDGGEKEALTKPYPDGTISDGEYQRYGRNKETTINHAYINSGEYRRKFDKITDNAELNRALYSKAKEMLNHRSGTMFEDMYWIDEVSGDEVASALNGKLEERIIYTKAIRKAISGQKNLIAFHTHPRSMPPSANDFNSMFEHGYKTAFVVCHDGKIIQYISNQRISEELYSMYVDQFRSNGFSEYEAQWKALEKLKAGYDIDFWEIMP